MTYKGYTIEEIKSILDYDPDTGIFKSKVSGKELVGRDFSYRESKSKVVTKFWLARLAVMFINDDYLDDKDRVTYKDGDIYNLKGDNLVVVPYQEIYQNKPNNPTNYYLETEYEHIFVGTLNKLFVVRRNSDQGIYRTYSKEEAVAVRDRWLESGKTLHKWDKFTPKWYRDYVKDPLTEQEIKRFDAKLQDFV